MAEKSTLERMAWRMAYEWAAGDLEDKDARLIADIEWIEWVDIARAALEAIREPTPELFKVGDARQAEGGEADDVFTAMIDAILQGKA